MADIWANSMACHPIATCHIAGCCHLANSMSWSQSYVSHCRVPSSGEFNGMSSQSHVSHCRVLPLGEFTVMIPEPHATLQGVVIPSAVLKIVFRHILFFVFLMQFGLWRAATFVSSPIHLFYNKICRIAVLLPRSAMLQRALTIGGVSVRASVCHTLVLTQN